MYPAASGRMTLAVAMIVRDEEENLPRVLASVEGLADKVYAVDTGSRDASREILKDSGATVMQIGWEGFAHARTRALSLASDHDWCLMLDADMEAEYHPDLKAWLDGDPDPQTDAWMVEINDNGLCWRLPYLTRGGREWRYEGATHSYLVGPPGKRRPLLGLTLHHHGTYSLDKMERDLELLAPGVEAGDPRSVYYTAWALKALGRTEEAAAMYDRRASMRGTWEEEAWHAAYWAAKLRQDVTGLIGVYMRRPHRPEPLREAARIVSRMQHDDVLFLESEG